MTLTPAVKAKLRDLLEQARVARAMQRAAYERHSELQEDLIAATREASRLRSSEERRRWANPNRAPGAAAPGAQTHADVLEKAERNVSRLKQRAAEAKKRQDDAADAVTALVRPLEKIAAHLKLEHVLGGGQDPLRNLEELVA